MKGTALLNLRFFKNIYWLQLYNNTALTTCRRKCHGVGGLDWKHGAGEVLMLLKQALYDPRPLNKYILSLDLLSKLWRPLTAR